MKSLFVILFSLMCFSLFSQRITYYDVLKNGNKKQLLHVIDNIPNIGSVNLKKAFSGALYCKLASYEAVVVDRIRNFKKGAELLEAAIVSEPMNVEFRFLRLIIQENAPSILRYNTNIDQDCFLIKNSFTKQTPELKLIISDYAKSSRKLIL